VGLEWEGRIVIDPTNDFDPSDLNGRTSSEVVAELVAPARVVKTANVWGPRCSLPTRTKRAVSA
jgi:8-hydroxy-5-deazaflavin:NADPH oxidoreductase